MNLLDRFFGWSLAPLIFPLFLFCFGVFCGASFSNTHYKAVISKMEAVQAKRETQIATAVLESQQEQITQLQGALDEAHEKTVQLQRDSAAAATANSRLRQSLTSFKAKHAAACSSSGEQDPDPIGVLADLLGRMGETGERISRHADEVKIAGAACEAAWPSLAKTESKPKGSE